VLDGLKENGLDNNGDVERRVNARVCELCARFPIYQG
jgi:glycine hydroxymethyltransferase